MTEQKVVKCPHCGTSNFATDTVCVYCKKDLSVAPNVNQYYFPGAHKVSVCISKITKGCVDTPKIIGNLNCIANIAMFLGIFGSIKTFVDFIKLINASNYYGSIPLFDLFAACVLYIFVGFVFKVCFNWMAKILDILSKSEENN